MPDTSDIGDRFKRYEAVTRYYLPRRIPVLLRIDGRAFHTVTRKLFGRGYDDNFVKCMRAVAKEVMAEMSGCDFAYGQSDEITFLLTDYKTVHTEPWFDYNLCKMISISAAVASVKMSYLLDTKVEFDARAFSVPQDDVVNNFIWRQQDATRNAIQMLGREHFSSKELHGVSCNQIQEKLITEKDINFNDVPTARKRGWCVLCGVSDLGIPIFTQDRNYINDFVDVRMD